MILHTIPNPQISDANCFNQFFCFNSNYGASCKTKNDDGPVMYYSYDDV